MALVQISRAYSLSSKRIEYREGSVAYTIFTVRNLFILKHERERGADNITFRITFEYIFFFLSPANVSIRAGYVR